MAQVPPRPGARVPIRRRVISATLTCALVVLALAVVTSMYFLSRMTQEAESLLADELRQSLTREVELRAERTEALFEEYKGYMCLLRDYTELMYENYDQLVRTGTFVDSSRATTPEGVYAMQSAFASPGYDLAAYHDEMYFLSHLESVLEPLAKGHRDEIATIYLGTTSGMLISYDQWSQLSAVPEPDFFVYDYTKSDWYTTGLAADDVFLTGLYVDSIGRGLTITIATPYHDATGRVAGVLAADFDITGIYDALISMDIGEGSSSIAIDEDGEIINIDSEHEVLAADHLGLTSDEAARVTSGETGVIESNGAFLAYAPVSDVGWTLCAIVPRSHLMEKVSLLEKSFRTAMLFFSVITVLLVLVATYVANRVAKSILLPIEQLVRDMRIVADGDLDHRACALRNDEVGDTSERLNEMVERLQGTIRELQSAQQRAEEMHALANKDALTSVKSKAAYDSYVLDLEEELRRGPVSFAVGAFDCDSLKAINDQYGHDRGDEYLKNTCRIICHVFKHSPVFRVGGDEFIVILRGDDFDHREELLGRFLECQDESVRCEQEPWRQVRVSVGIAVFDPARDASVTETVRRADKSMYANKAERKAASDNG